MAGSSDAGDKRGFVGKILSLIGPGLITAAVVLGPGSITISSKSGALLGYSVLWVVRTAVVLMITYTRIGAKIGLVSEASFLTLVAERYGRWLAVLLGLSGFLICTGYQTGNNIGAGLAMAAIFGGSMGLWAAVLTTVALVMMWLSSSIYDFLEKLMMVLVGVMICCFFGNLFRIRPDMAGLVKGFIPSRPGNFGLVVAISATTFSVAAAAFQPYLVQSKGWKRDDYAKGMRDAAAGIGILGVISCVIMITSATVLKPKGITVTSAVDMAQQLEPLLGAAAKWLFLFGLWAGAFSSFIINALIGGTFMADGINRGNRLDSFWAKLLASAVMGLATLVAIVFGANPIQLLIMAQATTILGVPLFAIMLVLIANDKTLMGDLRNGTVANVISAFAIVWLCALSVNQGVRLYEKATAHHPAPSTVASLVCSGPATSFRGASGVREAPASSSGRCLRSR